MDPSENLAAQLTEIEMLEAMLMREGEFALADPSIVAMARRCVASAPVSVPPIEFSLRVECESSAHAPVVVELACSLPREYPSLCAPSMIVRRMFSKCDAGATVYSRGACDALGGLVTARAAELNSGGQICVLSVVDWLRECAPAIVEPFHPRAMGGDARDGACSHDNARTDASALGLAREWIFFHHIYNPAKRRHIVDWARELGISGFAIPGKPGVVCAEGSPEAVAEYVQRIRRLPWQRMQTREREDIAPARAESGVLSRPPRLLPDPLVEVAFDGRAGPFASMQALLAYLAERGLEGHLRATLKLAGQ